MTLTDKESYRLSHSVLVEKVTNGRLVEDEMTAREKVSSAITEFETAVGGKITKVEVGTDLDRWIGTWHLEMDGEKDYREVPTAISIPVLDNLRAAALALPYTDQYGKPKVVWYGGKHSIVEELEER